MHILTQLNENEARNSIEQSICRDLLIPSNVHVCIYRFLIRNSSIFKQANLVHSKRSSLKKKTRSSAPPPPPRGARLVRGSLPAAAAAGVSEESAVANIPHRLITAPSDNVNLVFLSARARRRVHGLVSGELTN